MSNSLFTSAATAAPSATNSTTMSTTKQSTYLRVCPRCDSDRFAVTESYVHIGDVDEDGKLNYDSWPDGGGRERIECNDCELEFEEEQFNGVEYN